MNIILLFAIHLIFFSCLPFLFTLLKNPLRLSSFYIYLGCLVVFSQILGEFYLFILSDSISVSTLDFAQMIILFTIMLMIIIERDLVLIRNVIILFLFLTIFLTLFYPVLIISLQRQHLTTVVRIPPHFFRETLFNLLSRMILLILELLLLVRILEEVKKRIASLPILCLIYSVAFVVVACLDKVLLHFISSLLLTRRPLVNLVRELNVRLLIGVVLGFSQSVFLVVFRKRIRKYLIGPLKLWPLFRNRKIYLLREIQREKNARQESDALLKAITDSLHDCIFCKDVNFRYTFVNPAMGRLLKRPPKELLGKKEGEFFDDDAAAILERLDRLVLTGEVSNMIHGLKIAGEAHTVHTIKSPLRSRKGKVCGICGIMRDITDQHNTELQMKILNNRLQDKNNELEQIIYAASHDLRSPLVNIEGFHAELRYSVEEIAVLTADVQFDQPASRQIRQIISRDIPRWYEFIDASITRMTNFLASLLQIARLGRESVFLQSTDVNQLCADVLKSFEFQLLQKKVSVEIGNLPFCYSDRERLSQVFANLIDNAIKYLDPTRPGLIKITGGVDADTVFYCVQDNGIGINESYIPKIFEIFYRLDARHSKGEGIGLTIVKKILSLLDGEIKVSSTLGIGSSFCIKLPAGAEPGSSE